MSVSHYLERASEIARYVNRGATMQRVFDAAMVDEFDHPTLRHGEGPEARRLLGLVRWQETSSTEWAYLLTLLSHEAWFRERARDDLAAGAASFVRDVLDERGLLAERQNGRAA